MSRQDRNSVLKKHLESLKSGDYGKSFDDSYNVTLSDDFKTTITYLDIYSLHPAPSDWNFFPPISEAKMLEMIFSILENGLFNPIIAWEQDEGCMILSGHNRVEAYKRILNDYRDSPNFNEEDYTTIPSIVFTRDEINENKAKEIIIDTNYIQREEDKRLMPQIIKNRLEIVRNRRDKKGRTIDIVAEELGLSNTKVYEDQLIANRIIPELNELFFNNMLNKKSLLRFAWFNKDVQMWIYNSFQNRIIDDNVMKIKKHMSKDELRECFKGENADVKMITVSIRMPEEFREEFRTMAFEWLENKESSEP